MGQPPPEWCYKIRKSEGQIHLTCRTLIELLEYVRRKAILAGGVRVLGEGGGCGCCCLLRQPLVEELDEIVSSESSPCSIELDATGGRGGTVSAGASMPFFVVGVDRDPSEKRPLALGADATRRIKREAEAVTDLGLSGAWVRERDGVGGTGNVVCAGSAVSGVGVILALPASSTPLSDLVCCLVRPGVASERASADFWRCLAMAGPPLESIDCVVDELYDDLWSERYTGGVSGVCRMLPVEEDGKACVSIEDGAEKSFLDEELGKRKTDFQDDCGRGDGCESTTGACAFGSMVGCMALAEDNRQSGTLNRQLCKTASIDHSDSPQNAGWSDRSFDRCAVCLYAHGQQRRLRPRC